MTVYTASVTAPVNIATLKYWGKRDTKLNLPTNSSISVTLSQDDLRTLTSAATAPEFERDTLWLNGEPHSIDNERTQNCLRDLRQLRKEMELKDASLPTLSQWKLHIVSENNFPTAAGLASSAAGFAALVSAIAKLYQLPQSTSEISRIARKGSGSACRSLFGGYVAWEMGKAEDGHDSMAVQIADSSDWPQMKACVLVVSDIKKDVSSTQGMQLTVATSELFKERIEHVVPKRFEVMRKAIVEKDFATFAKETMMDSNSFHATCLDSFPPIFYMNDTSKRIISWCHTINQFYGETIVAYTFDAGPNAVLYYLAENESKLFAFIYKLFGSVPGWDKKFTTEQLEAFNHQFESSNFTARELDLELQKGVARVILTQVGSGPQETNESLIDAKTGLPKE